MRHWSILPPAIIIVGAMSVAAYWAFLVPIFQYPDEDYHADYVFSLYSRGRLIHGKDGTVVACSHPYIAYLLQATNARPIKYSDYVKVPAHYGSQQFFQTVNRNAPDRRTCALIRTTPYVVAMYPVGYYALAALWMRVLSHLNHSVIFLFFLGRFLSVILLGCGLTLTYLVLKELRLSYVTSLLILAAIGFFPMVTMVGSYIQPDNLCFVLVSLCWLLALRWRNSLRPARSASLPPSSLLDFSKIDSRIIWVLGLVFAAMLLTKHQFYVCVSIPVLSMIIAGAIRFRFPTKKIIAILAILIVPSIIAEIPQLWISWDCRLPTLNILWFPVDTYFKQAYSCGWSAFLAHIWDALYDEYCSLYWIHGATFSSFWGKFGWMNVPLIIVSKQFNNALRTVIVFITKLIMLLTLAGLLKIIASLWHLVKNGRARDAFYIACSNPVINSYFLFEVFFFLFNAYVYPSCGWQGRHWFTVILPIIISAAFFAPRLIPSLPIRKRFSSLIIIGWFCYSIVGSYYAIGCIHKRYYEPEDNRHINIGSLIPVKARAVCRIEHCDFVDPVTNFAAHANTLMVPKGDYMEIIGWAIDPMADAAASAVLIYIDNNKVYEPTCGIESWQAIARLHQKKYGFSGFSTLLPTKDLSPGWHSLSVKAVSKNGRFLYNTDASLRFIVIKQHE